MFEQSDASIENQLRKLKERSGSHSPSIFSLKSEIKGLHIKVDACFLSNPYATDLFLDYLYKDLIETGKLREVLEYYPSQNRAVAAILAPILKIPSDNIFVGNGATEIIQALIHNFTRRKIMVVLPTFSPYYEFVCPPIEVAYHLLKEEDDFAFHQEDYLDAVEREQPDTVVLISPNNPTGGYINRETLQGLMEALKPIEQIIVDESFVHFAYEDRRFFPVSYSDFVEKYPNCVIVKSMSKDFGIAGIRAGYALMAKEKVDRLLSHGYLWNISGLADYFFRLLGDERFLEKYDKIRIQYINETIEFYELLSEIPGIKVFPSQANFYLIELLDGVQADDMTFQLLLRYGIYCRSCTDKLGLQGNFIRIASRKKEDNRLIIYALREILQSRTKR